MSRRFDPLTLMAGLVCLVVASGALLSLVAPSLPAGALRIAGPACLISVGVVGLALARR